jgi:chromosome segregation ATPase
MSVESTISFLRHNRRAPVEKQLQVLQKEKNKRLDQLFNEQVEALEQRQALVEEHIGSIAEKVHALDPLRHQVNQINALSERVDELKNTQEEQQEILEEKKREIQIREEHLKSLQSGFKMLKQKLEEEHHPLLGKVGEFGQAATHNRRERNT